MYLDQLGILFKHRCWFSKSDVRPKHLHFYKLPRGFLPAVGLRTTVCVQFPVLWLGSIAPISSLAGSIRHWKLWVRWPSSNPLLSPTLNDSSFTSLTIIDWVQIVAVGNLSQRWMNRSPGVPEQTVASALCLHLLFPPYDPALIPATV